MGLDNEAKRNEKTIAEAITRIEAGDRDGFAELFPIVYEELRGQARGLLKSERSGHTLQATALVNEAYLKLVSGKTLGVAGETHVRAVSARALRQILVDHARARRSQKRGAGAVHVALDEERDKAGEPASTDILDLEDCLTELASLDPRRAQIAELKLFSELPSQEIATVLGVSRQTVDSDWMFVRAWLRTQLAGDGSPARPGQDQ